MDVQPLAKLETLRQHIVHDAVGIVVCGGEGIRFSGGEGKSLAPLCGLPLAAWAVAAAASAPSLTRIVVVCRSEDEAELVDALSGLPMVGEVLFARAGSTRQESVAKGLACVQDDVAYVCVHDGARPLVRSAIFESTLDALRADELLSGAIAAHPATDTIKVCERNVVVSTLERSRVWCVQTPQTFRASHLRQALERARTLGWEGTDDASIVERWGGRVLCVDSSCENIKVTYPEDLEIARAILSERLRGEWSGER